MINDKTIECWKINYGFHDKTPMEAAQWWRDQNGGRDLSAPVGAVLALAAAVEEIERLRGIIENLEMQSVDGIATGWVCVPAVEWQSNMDAALRGEGAG